MLINNIILNLNKNMPATDGTGALAYGQNSNTYNIPRGVILNLSKDKPDENINPFLLILNDEQKKAMKIHLKIGIYKQLHENGFINTFQLKKLISLNGGGDLC